MRTFLSSLLILAHLLCLSLPSSARESHGADVDLRVNHEVTEVAGSSTDTTKAASWASFLSPSYIIEGLQNAYLPTPLRLTSAIQAFLAPEPSPSDFWEKAKGYEQILQDYVPLLLTSADSYFKSTAFSDIAYSMKNIVHTTATFRDNIQDTLDAYHITIDSLTKELETVFMTIVDDLKNIPPPSKASGHAERDEVVNKILDDTELALVNLATRHGIQEDVVTTYLDTLRPHLRALIVAVGDINEQHPQLLPALAFSVAALLIPESWILRPLLSVFGFGPAGPVKGTAAAWMQRYFWGAAVEASSWFSLLQAAGMGILPKWAGLVTKAPLFVGALLAMLLPCFYRR